MRLKDQNCKLDNFVGECNDPATKIYEDSEAKWIRIPSNFLIKMINLDLLIKAAYRTFINRYKD